MKGTPTDCVIMGVNKVLEDLKPDLILSGVNRGHNLAEDVTYSGTIAAAMEGALLGIPSIALPIACGQTMSEPWLTARMIEALLVSPEHRVLEIGSGSGYATAILARLASQVVSVERFKSLVVEAQTRLDLLGLTNVDVVWGDGLALPPEQGPFDRILIHGLLDGLPEAIFGLLADGGIIVAGRAGEAGVRVVKLAHGPTGVTGEDVCPARLRPLIPGVARSL